MKTLLKNKEKMAKISINKHPYTFARVSAMRGKLIKKQDYHKILKMTISEISEYIGDYGYRKSIDELAVKFSGVDLIERGLFKNYTSTILKLKRISRAEVDILINSYVNRWDFLNIKTILRGRYTSTDASSLIVPVGNLDEKFLLKLCKLDSVEEILRQMKIVPFEKMSGALKDFKENNQLIMIENQLDKEFFNSMVSLASRITKGGYLYREFLQTNIDVANIKLILKLLRAKMPSNEIFGYVVKSGIFANEKFLLKSLSIDTNHFVNIMKKTDYKNAFSVDVVKSLVDIELELDKIRISKSFLSWNKNPLSALAILGYMLAKEAEVENIMTIARGKQLGLSNDFIEKKLLVIN